MLLGILRFLNTRKKSRICVANPDTHKVSISSDPLWHFSTKPLALHNKKLKVHNCRFKNLSICLGS